MVHRIAPPTADTLEELGREIAKLRYDAQIVLLEAYEKEIGRQAISDTASGRVKLARIGHQVEHVIWAVRGALMRMFTISIPYMKEELEKAPALIPPG